MKNEFWKFLIISIIIIAVINIIKHLIFPKGGTISFFISLITAVIIGLLLYNKITYIEK